MPFRKSNQPDCVVDDDVAQLAVAEGAIADEIDALDLGRPALGDLEHEIDAVLLELDDFRLDRRGEAALAAIDVEDALHVGLRAGAGEHRARLELDLGGQRRRIDLAVALEGDLIDDRVLDHGNDGSVALTIDADVGEQARREQRAERAIDLAGVVVVTRRELEVRANRLGLDTTISNHANFANRPALRLRHAGHAQRPAR